MSRPWALIQHVPSEGPATIAEEARACGVPLHTRRMFAGDPLPSANEIGGLIVMGGPMGANDDALHPHLPAERKLLADAIRADLPVLGVCLGAQLLAAALGARVTRGAAEEIGFGVVGLTPEGIRDPVLGGGAAIPVFHWHEDTYELPSGAAHLARSDVYPNQAFRVGGRAYGFQFHLEVDRSLYEAWIPRLPQGTAMDATLLPSVERAGRSVFRKFFERNIAS